MTAISCWIFSQCLPLDRLSAAARPFQLATVFAGILLSGGGSRELSDWEVYATLWVFYAMGATLAIWLGRRLTSSLRRGADETF